MTRCLMETLRLRAALPNGTCREILEDDYVIGLNREKVEIKKGTYIQIPNIVRHLNSLISYFFFIYFINDFC